MTNSSGSSITQGNRSVPDAVYESWITAAEKRAIAERFGWTCQLCLHPIDPDITHDYEYPDPERLVIDHVIPRRHGGTDDLSNLQPAHHRCNLRKGDKLISNQEFRSHGADRLARPSGFPERSTPDGEESEAQRGPHRHTQAPATVRQSGRRAVTQQGPIGSSLGQSETQRQRSASFWSTPHPPLLTHCGMGHLFNESNTYYRLRSDRGQGWRIERECRQCRRPGT